MKMEYDPVLSILDDGNFIYKMGNVQMEHIFQDETSIECFKQKSRK